ncbi:hypothetical protein DFH06DRAFT_46635 [Mycena polygramma]|nr:hypothetical protein DFH06DRAFT_46635 [Mycena polygramma]
MPPARNNHPQISAMKINEATLHGLNTMIFNVQSLRHKFPNYHVIAVGDLVTRNELTKMCEWMPENDFVNPPLLVIEEKFMAIPLCQFAVGIRGEFCLNIMTKSFPSRSHYVLDEIRAVCHPHLNDFGNRKRVFVERSFPADEERRFEFLGEFIVDIAPEGPWIWNALPLEIQKSILKQYDMALLTSPRCPTQFIGDHIVGSLVWSFYDQGDFVPIVRLMPYPEANCYCIVAPQQQ